MKASTLFFFLFLVLTQAYSVIGPSQSLSHDEERPDGMPTRTDKLEYSEDLSDEDFQDFVVALWVSIVLVTIIATILIGIKLCWVCMARRDRREYIKDQMRMKKAAFASTIGMNVHQLNRQIQNTIHI